MPLPANGGYRLRLLAPEGTLGERLGRDFPEGGHVCSHRARLAGRPVSPVLVSVIASVMQ